MATNLNKLVLATMVVAALLQGSWAQTTHLVGDALGWTIPPGGPIAYSTWASKNTFTVGDVLVFNFASSSHDVAEVAKAAFDACNSTNPISISTTGPTNITLTTAGEHHFICTFPGHCTAGQKLAINVTAAATSPSPPPSSSVKTYVVGESLGWNVLPNGTEAYKAWAADKTFLIGDTLVFNFVNGSHNVAEVTKAAYSACNTTTTISLTTTSPARITLTTVGEHFFTCTFPSHCTLGQQLAINVTGTTTAPSPPPTTAAPAPSPTATPPPTTATPAPSPTATPPPTTAAPTPSPAATPPPASTPTATPPPSTATPPPSPSPSGNTTPSTPPPSETTTAPPPPNSATSLASAALPVALLSIAVALLH
ncbi:hypothetical protein Acr_29g0000190 [Actinidia rufa]|uniref:Phytocyanin domain-containing protein n=1 Tax=Actinidia rufa TaxID=165716 RepID=A0A7J0HCK3_9ERIC|nr:hypothetical protein Acr_29g0000190 [Actinidia rufa]